MTKKRIVSMMLAGLMTLSLAACAAPSQSSAPQQPAGDTIKIGVIGPYTGSVAGYGVAVRNAVQLAFKEINESGGVLGKQIEATYMDDKADSTEAANAYNKLVSDGVKAIVGPVTSGVTAGVAALAAEDNMLILTPTATADTVTEGYASVFRTCFRDSYQGEMVAKFAAENLKVKKVAVLYASSDAYSAGLRDAFVGAAQTYGLELVAEESTSAMDAVEFTTQLTNIQAKGAEMIFVPFYYDTVGPYIVPQARSIGFTGVMMGTDGWDGTIGTMQADKSLYNNTYFTNHYAQDDPSEVVQNYVTNFTKEYGTEYLNAFAALGYDAAYMLKDAIEKAGTDDTAAIVQAMTGMNFSGVTGSFTLDETGTPAKSVAIIELKDGAAVWNSTVSAD